MSSPNPEEPSEQPPRPVVGDSGDVRSAADALRAAVADVDAQLARSFRELEDIRYALDQSAILATTDVTGRIKFVNDKFCQISRYSREELLGQDHRILNSSHHPKDYIRELWRTIAQGHVWRGELRNRAKDGTLYWVDTTIVPFLDGRNKPWQYMAIRYDITERKRQEAQLRQQATLAHLGEMAAVVAHEVRNPLAGIRGALQIIARDLKRTRVEARALLMNVAEWLKQDGTMADVAVTVEADDTVLDADPDQLRIVLSNLLLNAAQAMERRGRIAIYVCPHGSAECEIGVRDEGPGIPEDVRQRMFDPFFTTKNRGTGLGLPTARRIVEMHGGSIDIECPDEGGTLVRVTLPTAAPSA